jgi:hypothetical protein
MRRRAEGSRFFLAPGLRLAVALLCLTSSACFRYARIERRSSTTLEARIDRSDSETISVTSSEGQEQTISRSDVVDIDHPGKVRLTTGVLMVAGGAAMLLYGLVHQPCSGGGDACDYSGKVIAIVSAVPLLAGGGVLATSGGLTYYNSVTAATPSSVVPSTQAMRHSLPRLTCSFCSR